MSWRFSRRFFLTQLLYVVMSGCQSTHRRGGELTIGKIDYNADQQTINKFAEFRRYLAQKTKSHIRLEPVFNENKAIERIRAKAWSLVFAPPGVAATAIAQYQYLPIFPLVGVSDLRSVIVVRRDNNYQNLKQLQGQTVALGQPGSAEGYYFPLYNLYGLTLAEILLAPTPTTVLEWVAQGKATAGAVSMAQLNLYSKQLSQNEFRILYTDPHYVPPGVVLISSRVERNTQEFIRKFMSEFPSALAREVGYIPNGEVPDYRYMITVTERVRTIVSQLRSKPVRLF
jgi:phosphonate transport system substrate-binding protein